MKLILRPFTPLCSLIMLKKAVCVLPITPYAEAGPLYGLVWPILISVSLAPVSYFFCAKAGTAPSAIALGMAARIVRRVKRVIGRSPFRFVQYDFVGGSPRRTHTARTRPP